MLILSVVRKLMKETFYSIFQAGNNFLKILTDGVILLNLGAIHLIPVSPKSSFTKKTKVI